MFDIFSLLRWVRKHFTTQDVLIVLVLVGAFLATRLINLDKFPIFTDEGIYIHWAKVAWKNADSRFISLTDGKQPLHMWGMIPFLKIFSTNLLLGGRLYSVLTGAVALTGLTSMAYYLFGKRTAFFAGVFYVFTPMFLFYDRMALADSTVNAGFIWVLFGSIVLVRTLRLDVAVIFGITAGLALLAKSSSQLFLGLSALAPILTLHLKRKDYAKRIANFYFLFFISSLIAFVLYNVQRLSPYLHYVSEKNKTFVMTFDEFLSEPFSLVWHNLPLIPYYVASEMGYVLCIVGLVGLVLLYRHDRRLAFYLTLWILISYLGIAFMAKVIFPRYLIFFASALTLTAAYFIASLKSKSLVKGLLAVYIVSILYFDFTILFAPAMIPFPEVDRGQYIESFNAGWGITEIIDFARQQSTEKPVVLVGEGNFGVIADMLDASVAIDDKVSVVGYWPLNKADLEANQSKLIDNQVYIVFSHRTEFPGDWPMRFVKQYPKPGNKYSYYLYELTPSTVPPQQIPVAPL